MPTAGGGAYAERHPATLRGELGGSVRFWPAPAQGERAYRCVRFYRQDVRPFTDKQIALVAELRRPSRHCH